MVLPHDINTRDYTSGVSRLDSFREMNFGDPRPLPRMLIEDGLHATRVNLARCVFDKDACAKGLSHLKNACYEVDNKTGTIQNRVRHNESA